MRWSAQIQSRFREIIEVKDHSIHKFEEQDHNIQIDPIKIYNSLIQELKINLPEPKDHPFTSFRKSKPWFHKDCQGARKVLTAFHYLFKKIKQQTKIGNPTEAWGSKSSIQTSNLSKEKKNTLIPYGRK